MLRASRRAPRISSALWLPPRRQPMMLPAFEIHDDRQVTETAAQSQISEVLAPGVGFGHQAVILAGPRPPGIFEDGIFAQNIGRRLRLGLAPTITPPFGSDRDNNAGQIADPAGLVGAPV